jgi:hypothetical protein
MTHHLRDEEGGDVVPSPVSAKAYFLLIPAWGVAGLVFVAAQHYLWTSPLAKRIWQLVPRATIVFTVTTACLYKPLLSWLERSGHRRGDSSVVLLVMAGTATYFIPFVLAFPEGALAAFFPSPEVAPFLLAYAASGLTFASMFAAVFHTRPRRGH